MSRPTFVTIDLAALAHNFARVRQLTAGQSIIAMVKANAYGHGIVRVAQALEQAESFGVASLEEGIKLREAGIKKPIVLVEGLFYPEELVEAEKYQFTLVVHHTLHVETLEKAQLTTPLHVWLKINTGMHRLGIDPLQVKEIYQRLFHAQAVQKPIGLMTHLAEADSTKSNVTKEQIKIFNEATMHLSGPRSLANSAGILAWPETHADWIRPGLMLYGASPFNGSIGIEHNLKPVMTLSSRLIAITEVKKG